MHKFNKSFVLQFYILRLTSLVWANTSDEGLKFESPSKRNSYESFNLVHRWDPWMWSLVLKRKEPDTGARVCQADSFKASSFKEELCTGSSGKGHSLTIKSSLCILLSLCCSTHQRQYPWIHFRCLEIGPWWLPYILVQMGMPQTQQTGVSKLCCLPVRWWRIWFESFMRERWTVVSPWIVMHNYFNTCNLKAVPDSVRNTLET